jgi:hypothetical protein
MNVFENDFKDEDEQKRQRAEYRMYIEEQFPEPKYKPKIKRRNWRDILKACKIIKGQQTIDSSNKEQFIMLRKRGRS